MNVHRQVRSELRFLILSVIALGVGYLVFVYPHTNDFGISDKECDALVEYGKSNAERDFQFGEVPKSKRGEFCQKIVWGSKETHDGCGTSIQTMAK